MSKTETKAEARPDAVKIPLFADHLKGDLRRGNAVLDVAERILKPDKPNGERAYVRRGRDGYFATRSEKDGEFFPSSHHRRTQPLFHWKPAGDKEIDGVLVGVYRDDEAKGAYGA